MSEQEQKNCYQTGRTAPPKSHQGMIAVLLILVILLIGIVTGLGLMNIHLFRQLDSLLQEDDQPISVIEDDRPGTDTMREESWPELGLEGVGLSTLYRTYKKWPAGIYVSKIRPGSPAEKADIRIGDIITNLNEKAVADPESFRNMLGGLPSKTAVPVTVYRQGEYKNLTLETE
jgi:C-terminal processing protease CtpA/Prc